MGNATALLNVVRNLGGGVGVAAGEHAPGPAEPEAPGHAGPARQSCGRGDGGAAVGRGRPTSCAHGADSFTAQQRALARVYQELTRQAQVLAFADDFWLLFVLFCGSLVLLPTLQRVHIVVVQAFRRGRPTDHSRGVTPRSATPARRLLPGLRAGDRRSRSATAPPGRVAWAVWPFGAPHVKQSGRRPSAWCGACRAARGRGRAGAVHGLAVVPHHEVADPPLVRVDELPLGGVLDEVTQEGARLRHRPAEMPPACEDR